MTQRIIVYTKNGCHLCEDLLTLLNDLQSECPITIEEIDIERDPGLFTQYFDKIPVLVFANGTTLAAPIRVEDVRAALKS